MGFLRILSILVILAGLSIPFSAPLRAQIPDISNFGAPGGGGSIIQSVKNGDTGRLRRHLATAESPNDVDATGRSALIIASQDGKCDMAAMLLEAHARTEIKDQAGYTALAWAAERGNVSCVDLLLAAHADVNATNRQGETPIMRAAATGRVDIIKKLIAAKADVTVTDYTGRTALTIAEANRHKPAADALRAAGATN